MDLFTDPQINQSCVAMKTNIPCIFRDSEWESLKVDSNPAVSMRRCSNGSSVPMYELVDLSHESLLSAAYHCWTHTCYQIQALPSCDKSNVVILIEGVNRFNLACLKLYPEFREKIMLMNRRNVTMIAFTWPGGYDQAKRFESAVESCREAVKCRDAVMVKHCANKRTAIRGRRHYETNGFHLASVMKWAVLGITAPTTGAIKRHNWFGGAPPDSLLVIIPVVKGSGAMIGQAIRRSLPLTDVTVVMLLQREVVRAIQNTHNTRYNWIRMLIGIGSDVVTPVSMCHARAERCHSVLGANGMCLSDTALARFDAVLFVSVADD